MVKVDPTGLIFQSHPQNLLSNVDLKTLLFILYTFFACYCSVDICPSLHISNIYLVRHFLILCSWKLFMYLIVILFRIQLLAVVLPLVGLGTFLWWAAQDMVQDSVRPLLTFVSLLFYWYRRLTIGHVKWVSLQQFHNISNWWCLHKYTIYNLVSCKIS